MRDVRFQGEAAFRELLRDVAFWTRSSHKGERMLDNTVQAGYVAGL